MVDKVHSGPTERELKELAEDLVDTENTMTLATAQLNVAWAAPVYYVFLNSCFYFFSNPTSRHIQESLASGQTASAVYASASSWQEIRGIQMAGSIEAVSVSLEAIEAVRAYLKKFPFTGDFFSSHEDMNLAAFAKRFSVKLYRLRPDLIFYMDNGIRFGFRANITI